MTDDIHDRIAEVSDFKMLAKFITALRLDMAAHPDSYESITLDDYLEALAAFSDDYDGYCTNKGLDASAPPSWKTFANLIYAAGIYE